MKKKKKLVALRKKVPVANKFFHFGLLGGNIQNLSFLELKMDSAHSLVRLIS